MPFMMASDEDFTLDLNAVYEWLRMLPEVVNEFVENSNMKNDEVRETKRRRV